MAAFDGLGKALRWLRARQDKRQYEVAEKAGVTKAMLSAYETEKQRPSLETLEKILEGLDATLEDLYQALLVINGEGDAFRVAADAASRRRTLSGSDGDVDVQQVLGLREPLPVEEKHALEEMLGGFHRLLRYMHGQLHQGRRRSED